MLSTYALLMWLNFSIYTVIALFGGFVSAAMLLVRKHHQRNLRAGTLPPIPSETH
jgi:hypothetical protein